MSSMWTYETKCRRCLKMTGWYFADRDKVSWIAFSKAMIDMLSFPRSYECSRCKKNTVQDVISHDQP